MTFFHDPEVADRAAEADRLWFAAHPGRSHRIRPPLPGEAPVPRRGVLYVLVHQLFPGCRMRVPFPAASALPDGECPEDAAAELFAAMVQHHAGVRQAFAAMLALDPAREVLQ